MSPTEVAQAAKPGAVADEGALAVAKAVADQFEVAKDPAAAQKAGRAVQGAIDERRSSPGSL